VDRVQGGRSKRLPLSSDAISPRPTKALDRTSPRAILGPDPSVVAEFIEQFEQVGVFDLTEVRLMAAWNARNVNVANPVDVFDRSGREGSN